MKATEEYSTVVLFITLHKVVLIFKSVDEILNCDHSHQGTKQYFPGAVCYALPGRIIEKKGNGGLAICMHHFSPHFLFPSPITPYCDT